MSTTICFPTMFFFFFCEEIRKIQYFGEMELCTITDCTGMSAIIIGTVLYQNITLSSDLRLAQACLR